MIRASLFKKVCDNYNLKVEIKKRVKLTNEIKEQIINYYKNNVSVRDIEKLIHLSRETIYKIIKEL